MTDEPNSRVTTREFYEQLKELRKEQSSEFKELRAERGEMERRIVDKIDCISEDFATKDDVAKTKEDITDLRKRVRNTDIFLGAAVVVSTAIQTAISSVLGDR